MALADVSVPAVPVKKSGGFLGKVGGALGGLVSLGGLAAAPFTGGLSGAVFKGAQAAAGAIGGASSLGDVLNPAKQSGGTQVKVQQTAVDRRMQSDPQATIATINQSLAAIQQADAKTRSTYEPFLMAAKQAAESRLV